MSKPVAVVISDVHYDRNTLELADYSVRQAINKANELCVPLIDTGDLHTTKSTLQAECVTAMIETFKTALVPVYVLIGNHNLLNEKGDDHALHFLEPYVNLVSSKVKVLGMYMLPYFSDVEELQKELSTIPEGSTVFLHQGVQTANMGHYVQDKTSLPKEAFADFRVISGHYHRHQDIKCGRPRKGAVGLFTYIGNPYTLSFGEANDGPKGYCILMEDGTLEQIPLDLRKHVILDLYHEEVLRTHCPDLQPNDLLWLKVTGPQSELAKLKKDEIGKVLLGHSNFKLDLIPTDSKPIIGKTDNMTGAQIFDSLIDNTGETTEQKTYLKALWKELV